MRKRGQGNVLHYLIALVILGVLALSFRFFAEVGERESDAALLNLHSSLQASLLQQAVQEKGSSRNLSFAVPGNVEEVCFLDSTQRAEYLRNPELIGTFGEDPVSRVFLRKDGEYLPFSLNKLTLPSGKNPLCVSPVNQRVTLSLTSTGLETEADASSGEQIACTRVLENGDPSAKMDLVFLGHGYANPAVFSRDVDRSVNNLLFAVEPFQSEKGRFNVYRVDDAELSCELGSYISCDAFSVQLAASQCPHDAIFVLVERSLFADILRPVRSSALSNVVKVNTADRPLVLVHEFGHLFDLADEYVDGSTYTLRNFDVEAAPNCDTAPCPSWRSVDDASCWQGCSLDDYFRPTETSIMRSLSSSAFGPVNEREILRRLLYYD